MSKHKKLLTLNVLSMNEAQKTVRRSWVIKPFSRIVESKKKYDRKDKSWKTED